MALLLRPGTLAVVALALGVSIASAPVGVASMQGNCESFKGTLYGSHQTQPIPAWVGKALISLGGNDPEPATFIDVSVQGTLEVDRLLAGKPFRGQEILTLTFSDKSTLPLDAAFIGVPASTPGLFMLNETAEVSVGTGRFSAAVGHITVHGPFVSPVVDPAPPFIGEMYGSVCSVLP